tara:strand:+ start:56 stop:583 length:528 start_codon:yes stop_codon:yes gene_type:complete
MKLKNQSAIAIGLIAMSISFSSLADSRHSFGPSYLSTSAGELSFTSPGIVYEYKNSETLSIEVNLNGGGTDEYSSIDFLEAADIDSIISTKLKFSGASEGLRFYGSIGLASISINSYLCIYGQCNNLSLSANGLTAGVGVDLDLGEKWILGGQFSKGFGDLDELDLMGLNLLYKF